MATKRAVAINRPRERYQPYTPTPFTGALEQPWRTVLGNPSDLDARSVLADALLDAGDPRGEFLQLALKKQPTPAQGERREELFGRLSPEWRRALHSGDRNLRGIGFENGLPEIAHVQLRSVSALDWLHERAPIRELNASDYEADPQWVEWLPRHPLVKHLRKLSAGGERSEKTEPLIATGAFASIDTLEVVAPLTLSFAKTLAEKTPALRSLILRHTGDELEPATLRTLASLPLQSLRLEGVSLSAAATKELERFVRLERLELRSAAVEWSALPSLPTLRALSLESSAPALESLAAFLRRSAPLAELALNNVGLSADTVSLMLGGTATLESLSLNSNTLRDGGVAALAKLDFPELRELSLSQVRAAPLGFASLALAEWPLERADFVLNALDEAGATSLASGPLCRDLKALELLMTSVGSRGARALSAAPWLPRLESLSLFSNRIGNTGLRALLEHMPNAQTLFLGRENPFKEEGLLVATRGVLPRLRHLRVDEVKGNTIEAFVDSGHADGLHTFGFGNSEITAAAASALVTLPRVHTGGAPWSRIESQALELLKSRWPHFAT